MGCSVTPVEVEIDVFCASKWGFCRGFGSDDGSFCTSEISGDKADAERSY